MKKELKANQLASKIAEEISRNTSRENIRNIDPMLVIDCIKREVEDTNLIDEVFYKTMMLLEYKYGDVYDVDKNVEI